MVKPEIVYQRERDSAQTALEKASTALDQCEFPGPCSEAAMHSRIELIRTLVTGVE